VLVSRSGLVTVTGGKWTTYRAMAEDVLTTCFEQHLLEPRPGVTATLHLLGGDPAPVRPVGLNQPQGLHSYGSEAGAVLALPGAQRVLGGGLTEAMVRFAAQREYARTVEDVLARRWRLLFLDARLAQTLAPEVAAILQQETGIDPQVSAFQELAASYLALPQ
jgi:glycerol-3-phosphate dehydrogenase